MQNRKEIRKKSKKLAKKAENFASQHEDEKAARYYLRAAKELKKISKTNRSNRDLYHISDFYNNASVDIADESKSRMLHKNAIKYLKKIPKHKRKPRAIMCLALYQYNTHTYVESVEEQRKACQKALRTIGSVPPEKRESFGWRVFVDCHITLGKLHKKNDNWSKAWSHFQAALTAPKIEYSSIQKCYKYFRLMSNIFSLDAQINGLGQEIFAGLNSSLSDLNAAFLRIHFQLLHMRDQHVLLQMIQLMRLLLTYGPCSDFPNKDISNWLNQPGEADRFNCKLNELESIYQPLALTGLLEQGHSVTLALVLEIQGLKNRIADLEKALSSQQSYYASSLTVFGRGNKSEEIGITEGEEEMAKQEEGNKNGLIRSAYPA